MASKRNSHWPISILSSLSALLNMSIPLVMVRLLSPTEVGTFKIFFLYVFMMPAFAMNTGLLSGLGYWAGQGEKGLRAIRLSNGFSIIVGVTIGLVCLIASPLIVARFHWPLRYGLYFAASAFGATCVIFLEETWIVRGKIWAGAIYQSGSDVLRTAAVIAVAFAFRNVGAILLVSSVLASGKILVSLGVGRKQDVVRFGIDREIARGIIRYALPVSLAALFGIFTTLGDQLVLSNMISPAQFAMYSIGCLTIPPLIILEQSVTRVMIPQLSASFASGDQRSAAEHYGDAVEQLGWLIIPAVTGLMVFAKPIIELLFTTRYSEAAGYLHWYALSYLFLIFPYDAVPRSRGEGRWIFKNFAIFAPVALVLCYALGKTYGPYGALAGLLLSQAMMRVYCVLYIRSSTRWKFREFLPIGQLLVFATVSVGIGALCLFLKSAEFSHYSGLRWFLTCGPIFVVLYFPIAVLMMNWRDRRRFMAGGGEGRVLLFSQHLGVGGLERLVLSLGRTLQAGDRWKAFVFSHDSEENAQSYTQSSLVGDFLASGIPVDALKKGGGISFSTLYRLVKNIYQNRINVIHSHDMGTLVYAVLANLLTLGRVRIVHTQHSFVHINRNKRYALYERIFTTFVHSLTVVNESLVEPYAKLGVSPERIHVINNGVSFAGAPLGGRSEKLAARRHLLESLAPEEREKVEGVAKDYWLLYLARLHSVKGQREAASLWTEFDPALRARSALIIVGPEAEAGERERVLKAFESVPDRGRVILTGGTKVPQEWLNASDVFLSCSKVEGMPLGPLEAIGSGLPAVLSSISGHRFLESVSGQYSLDRPSDGGKRIQEVLENPTFGSASYYQELWGRASWVREQFSLEAMAERYAKLYEGGP